MNPMIYTLPIIAAIIGWFTNYLAVKMLFRPRRKIKIWFIEIQGIFPKRQEVMAQKIAKLVSAELLSIQDIKEQLAQPENIEHVKENIEQKLDDYLGTTFPSNYRFLSMLVGKKTKDKLKDDVMQEIHQLAPQIVDQYMTKMEGQFNIERVIQDKISLFSPVKLEELIMAVLKKEFKFIELIGAVIGFFIGLIQLAIVHL